jgi:hypothetical protein
MKKIIKIVTCLFIFYTLYVIFDHFESKSTYQPRVIVESMDTSKVDNIIVLGDSIFKNNIYVDKNKSVEFLMHKNIDTNITFLAQDGATIDSVTNLQLSKIPRQTKHELTYMYLSVGGNDILESIFVFYDKNAIYEIIYDYQKLVQHLLNTFSHAFIKLCTIYYPVDKKYKKYHKIIKIWNNELKKLIAKHNTKNLQLFETDKYLFSKKHFTHSIEPSDNGGKLLVKNIVNDIQSD